MATRCALTCTNCCAFCCSLRSLRTRKTPSPSKFFISGNPFISEFEHGQLKELWSRISQNEVSFIMYYAPWDADCIRARNEIEIVSNHYGQQVSLIACFPLCNQLTIANRSFTIACRFILEQSTAGGLKASAANIKMYTDILIWWLTFAPRVRWSTKGPFWPVT